MDESDMGDSWIREKIRMKESGFAVSRQRRGERGQDTPVLWLQEVQIKRTQLVLSTAGTCPTVSTGSFNPAGIGRIRTSGPEDNFDSTQSRLTCLAPLY